MAVRTAPRGAVATPFHETMSERDGKGAFEADIPANAVEEALQIVAKTGGEVTVVTIGSDEDEEIVQSNGYAVWKANRWRKGDRHPDGYQPTDAQHSRLRSGFPSVSPRGVEDLHGLSCHDDLPAAPNTTSCTVLP